MAIAATAPGTRLTQMNTRIDARLKEDGDAVLARLGYTPSAAVRGLWRYVVDHQDDEAAVRQVIEPEAASALSDAAARKVFASAELRSLYAHTAEALGISGTAPADLSTWDELRDAWYDERLDGEA